MFSVDKQNNIFKNLTFLRIIFLMKFPLKISHRRNKNFKSSRRKKNGFYNYTSHSYRNILNILIIFITRSGNMITRKYYNYQDEKY